MHNNPFAETLIVALSAYVRHETDAATAAALKRTLSPILKELKLMAANLTALTAAVERTRGVEASVLILLAGLKDQVAKLSAENNDPSLQLAIDALVESLDAGAQPIAEAVASNPADVPPAPPAEPDPEPVA